MSNNKLTDNEKTFLIERFKFCESKPLNKEFFYTLNLQQVEFLVERNKKQIVNNASFHEYCFEIEKRYNELHKQK
jgi:hypothetical protein